ncbi:tetratricopeptide repeat protein [Dyella sp.]|jgi:tetratricopeptide (TPR) repeat protein|uniref:tetratricopeptide repeat protein n=1 Tax=Dyella sp. TaxID=1869338 RepID=UPI002D76711E|nr:tetratricopeptide repeat protein [Dyella sp.]HET6430721.1 tetratricopeptide repeat protein [Dyella sp.]
MKLSLRFMRPLLPLIAPALLAGCFQSVQPTPPVAAARPNYDLVAAIRAAGEREKSIIDVSPLREPAVTALQDAAAADERAGRYADAAAKLDQALKLSPESPDLLQERAELAVRLRDFAAAERLAHQSWTLGPQLGPLCARNWQTIVEMRLQADDAAGAASARKWVQTCHKAGINRY